MLSLPPPPPLYASDLAARNGGDKVGYVSVWEGRTLRYRAAVPPRSGVLAPLDVVFSKRPWLTATKGVEARLRLGGWDCPSFVAILDGRLIRG